MLSDFGNYEVLSEIGRGGMGIVYQALDRENERMVAIKQLVLENIDPSKHREFKDRFRREASMAARLDHANIVSVYDVGEGNESDSHYYVMEFLDGHSLRTELEQRGGRMTPEEYLPILRQVAAGLAYAHSLNVVHRDVKPDNIFILRDGQVKLTDFGIARAVDYEQTHLTKTGVMLGTLAYVSPEQLQDAKNVDHRADIFSLAVVTYEALSGRLPFVGEGIAQTVIRILSSEPESLHTLVPGLPLKTAGVVSKALRKKARDRYMSVMDMVHDFELSLSDPVAATDTAAAPVNAAEASQAPAPAAVAPAAATDLMLTEGAGVAHGHVITPRSSQGARVPVSPYVTRISQGAAHYMVKPVGSIGKKGDAYGSFLEPAVVCARSGRIVVADTAQRSLQVFSHDGRWLSKIMAKSSAKDSHTLGGSLTTPSGLSFDDRGRLFVCDSADHFVRVFDNQGGFLKEFKNPRGRDGGLQGIVCDSTGLVYVADGDNACLQIFQSDSGTWLRKVGSKGTQLGQFQMPSGLAVDRFNQVYVVDYATSKVSVFGRAGNCLRSFGGKGTANGLFNVPRGVAVDRHDRIYVSDSLNHRVQIFGPGGEWLYSFGGRGTEPGRFVGPAGICIDLDRNYLYVADKGNHRIQIFELIEG